MLLIVSDFTILPFSKLFSDIHKPISVKLNVCPESRPGKSADTGNDISKIEVVNKWNDEHKDRFCQELYNYAQDVNVLCNELDTLENAPLVCDDIDRVVNKTCTILLDCAKVTFGSRTIQKKTKRKCNVSKPWFTNKCRYARVNFRKAKRMYKKYRNSVFKDDLILKEKTYKRTMDQAIKEHSHNMRKKLRYIKTSNPKEYWKVINTGNYNKKCESKVDLIKFFEFFKERNTDKNVNIPSYVIDEEELDILATLEANVFINEPITTEKILKCVKHLKRNKAAGSDCIYNEYIKASCDIMLPLYTKLFNAILDDII